MALIWRDEMSIDGGVIDDDHKCLIALVNDVEAIQPDAAMHALVELVIARLVTYAQVHFEREERLQARSAFTYALAHRSRHRTILKHMDAMLAECRHLPATALPAFHARLCDYLYDWLRDHIFKADMLMKPFVAQMQTHAAHVASLPDAVRAAIEDERLQPTMPLRQLLLPMSRPHLRRM